MHTRSAVMWHGGGADNSLLEQERAALELELARLKRNMDRSRSTAHHCCADAVLSFCDARRCASKQGVLRIIVSKTRSKAVTRHHISRSTPPGDKLSASLHSHHLAFRLLNLILEIARFY